jgi:P27 family predicted phage terminase small subunit
MEGLAILDDLDSDTLGVYCVMMARYKQQCALLNQAGKRLKEAGKDVEAVEAAVAQIDAVSAKMTTLEKTILQYADKLGLTPSSRTRLAQKRAEQASAQIDPDGDLFGD